MTRDDFHFIVPEICSTVKNTKELLEVLKSFVVSGYNVGEEFEKRTMEFLSYTPSNDILWKEFIPEPGILAVPDNKNDHEIEISNLLEILKNISSTKTKCEILKNWFEVQTEYSKELFLKFIHLTFSSIFTFNATIKIFESNTKIVESGINLVNLEYALVELEKIGMDEETKPKEKIEKILHLWNSSTFEARRLIELIISRKLDIGMNEKTFFDVLDPLCSTKRILLVPYQRCEKEDKIDRIQTPCIAQLKADGKFQNLIFDPIRNLGLSLNRSGIRSNFKFYELFTLFNQETGYFLNIWPGIKLTLTGEALVKLPGETVIGKSALDIKVYERETGNGLLGSYANRFSTFRSLFYDINNAIDGKGNKKLFKRLEKLISVLLEWKYVEDNTIFQLWNLFPTDTWLKLNTGMTCKQSLEWVTHFIHHYNQWIQTKGIDTNLVLIHSEIFEDLDSVYDLYYRVLGKGMEGLVVKNFDAIIEHGTSTGGIIKLKDFKDCELKIIGYLPGTGKYTGGIGSFDMVTECGRMILNVAGITDKQRGFERVDPNDSSKGLKLIEGFNTNDFTNKIYTVKYNKLSKDKHGKPSLSLPSIMEERTDITRASFLKEIKK
jgi:hypothetical protein